MTIRDQANAESALHARDAGRNLMQPVHEEIAEILEDDQDDRFSDPREIRKKAMDFLALRDYGQAELVLKLANKGYKRALVEDEIQRLTDEGLQSDTRFAEAFVQSRINQGKGPVRIRSELGQKGIPDGIVETAIEAAPVDWWELATDVRMRKFGSVQPDDFKEKARQMRFLQYRGFEGDQIRSAVGD